MKRDTRFSFFSWFRTTPVSHRNNRTDREPATANAGKPVPVVDPDLRPVPRQVHDAANTYIFSLAPIRTKLGNHWKEFGPSIHRIANRLVFSKLDGKATVEQYGEVYVLTFDRLKGIRAQAEGERLFTQFMELLTTGLGPDTIAVRGKRVKRRNTRKKSKTARLLLRPFQRLKSFFTNNRGIGAVIQLWDYVAAAPPVAKPTDNGDAAADASQTAMNRVPATDLLGDPSVRKRVAKSVTFQPNVASEFGADFQAARQHLHSSVRRRSNIKSRAIENAMAVAVRRRQSEWAAEMARQNFPPSDLTFIYRSIWNFGKRQLTTFSSVPMCWKNGLEFYYGEDVVPPPRRPSALFDLDMLCLKNTIEMLDFDTKGRREVFYLNAVHASTLADKEMLGEFMALVKSVPKTHCRQLIFEIIDITDYVFRPDAAQMVKNLSPYALAISASVAVDDRNFAFWKQCGFTAIGADLARDGRSESYIFSNLQQFATQAKQVGLLTYLRGLDKPSLTISAAAAGFNFLEGPVIGNSDDPEQVTRAKFRIENLYDDAQAADIGEASGT